VTTSKTIVFTGQGYNLTRHGAPDPDDPMYYYDEKSNKVLVTLKKIRCKIVTLYDNGYAVIESNRSGARYGVKIGKLRR
jgi:hypothetical protein